MSKGSAKRDAKAFKFETEDFLCIADIHDLSGKQIRQSVTYLANKKLEEWLAQAPVVFTDSQGNQWFSTHVPSSDMQKARLVQIEPIVQESEERKLLRKFTNTVDESLLLDENLAEAWGTLRAAVVEARKLLSDS